MPTPALTAAARRRGVVIAAAALSMVAVLLVPPGARAASAIRIHIPGERVLDGRWTPPGIVCLDCHPR